MVRLGSLMRRKALDSTLSRRAVKGEPPHMWEQYSMQGRISPTYNWRSCSEEKYVRHLNSTPSFLEADFATSEMCCLQDKFEVIPMPKILIEFRGWITLLSNTIS